MRQTRLPLCTRAMLGAASWPLLSQFLQPKTLPHALELTGFPSSFRPQLEYRLFRGHSVSTLLHVLPCAALRQRPSTVPASAHPTITEFTVCCLPFHLAHQKQLPSIAVWQLGVHTWHGQPSVLGKEASDLANKQKSLAGCLPPRFWGGADHPPPRISQPRSWRWGLLPT